jgi:hypothetical protein
MKKTTVEPGNSIFQRLLDVAKLANGGRSGQRFLECDLLHQDALFAVQEAVAALLLEMAKIPAEQHLLARTFPGTFQVEGEK